MKTSRTSFFSTLAFTIHDELRDEALRAGCHGLIQKPVNPHDLVDRVHELLPPQK